MSLARWRCTCASIRRPQHLVGLRYSVGRRRREEIIQRNLALRLKHVLEHVGRTPRPRDERGEQVGTPPLLQRQQDHVDCLKARHVGGFAQRFPEIVVQSGRFHFVAKLVLEPQHPQGLGELVRTDRPEETVHADALLRARVIHCEAPEGLLDAGDERLQRLRPYGGADLPHEPPIQRGEDELTSMQRRGGRQRRL
ncbi:type VI secretion system baseplate subunit TssE [Babesia caballi]|uniref:Type VI secretion system baseplate subunit TssE n=1 Tax=Babesia caballi TaxID=5871 RepID=A0AAV4LRL3_BABCB|nr:type VI secretion system baseplate subunit TssE [Babesia caballi]